ncbi:SDR family NAD(P)-dependent oxidoreductase [Falsiroseomonas sp.]|uniref:SDR family NAD(P)-dependent oxidoreductase n=1 Tax=Falsiroseomonas sp. TaxID=2870721 RepID=UPI003F6FB7F2
MTAPRRVLILGGNSGIAVAAARLYAAEGAAIGLAGRDGARLEAVAADLMARGATVAPIFVLDLADEADPAARLREMNATLGGLDDVLLAYGSMAPQAENERDLAAARHTLDVNFSSAALWALATAALMEAQGRGSLIVLGSVAGDRGRRKNFVYGAAKAGIAVLIEGIAHRFGRPGAPPGIRAVLVKAGPTRTAMTAGMMREGATWADPEDVARIIRRAADRGGPIIYAPGRWRSIMLVIRHLPARIFNRLDI